VLAGTPPGERGDRFNDMEIPDLWPLLDDCWRMKPEDRSDISALFDKVGDPEEIIEVLTNLMQHITSIASK
jgi:hypothetical protein